MSRKDYQAIAAELNRSYPAIERAADMTDSQASQRIGFALAVEAVARALSHENPRFDSGRFYSAVYNG